MLGILPITGVLQCIASRGNVPNPEESSSQTAKQDLPNSEVNSGFLKNKDELTTDLEEFNTTNKSIALQIVSGREGINLSAAKYIVYYNIDFSRC